MPFVLVPRLTRWAQSRVGEDDLNGLSLRQLTALQIIEHQEATLGDVARQLMVTPAW
jgi:DNA-binding MarR family transcriptional regulator